MTRRVGHCTLTIVHQPAHARDKINNRKFMIWMSQDPLIVICSSKANVYRCAAVVDRPIVDFDGAHAGSV